MKFNLPQIQKGMVLKCLNCENPIVLTDETFTMDFEAEYIKCLSCGYKKDVQIYHMYGEEIKE